MQRSARSMSRRQPLPRPLRLRGALRGTLLGGLLVALVLLATLLAWLQPGVIMSLGSRLIACF